MVKLKDRRNSRYPLSRSTYIEDKGTAQNLTICHGFFDLSDTPMAPVDKCVLSNMTYHGAFKRNYHAVIAGLIK